MADELGVPRKPLTFLGSFVKTVLEADHDGAHYEVEVDFTRFSKDAALYADGALAERRSTPAKFPLGDGARLEVATSMVGIKRARLVTPEGAVPMRPHPESAEYKRIRWDGRHPRAARVIAALSVTALLCALVLGAFYAVALGSQILTETELGNLLGFTYDYSVPFDLPEGAATVITVVTLAAAIDRASRLKYSRWLDSGLGDLID